MSRTDPQLRAYALRRMCDAIDRVLATDDHKAQANRWAKAWQDWYAASVQAEGIDADSEPMPLE